MGKQLSIPAERIERSILLIRGQKVMLDSDLAELYGVETKNLNKAVKRNLDRFPTDFMFQLAAEEAEALRFQFGTSKAARGGRRYLPNAFTEQGVAMLSSVLRSKRAVEVNIAIMRAFVRLREILATHKDLAAKLAELERKLGEHDEKFQIVFEAIRQLMAPPPAPKKRRIGFLATDDDAPRPHTAEQVRRKRIVRQHDD
ncbi:MAG TPA: ORF6N domain-containing protein [Pirellulales bacterium]|nr:ORF6N domain-containing protein [Pirellulales bacterium]